jgi:uncharacterized protein (TIGR02266 family)
MPTSHTGFRTHTRAPLAARVTLRFDDHPELVYAHTANVSEGGMFVAMTNPRPVGTLVRFELHLSAVEAATGLAEVVWIRVRGGEPAWPVGMGMQYRQLDGAGAELLRKHVQPLLT